MRKITWAVKAALKPLPRSFYQLCRFHIKDFKFWRYSSIFWLFLAMFSLHMRRNGYSCASGENSDISVRYFDPYFLIGVESLAIRRRLQFIFYRINKTSAIFLFPVYSIYWLRKPATWEVIHVDFEFMLVKYAPFVIINWLCISWAVSSTKRVH